MRPAALASLLLAAALAFPARASVAVRASVEDLAGLAHLAVEGDVLDHATTLDSAAGAVWTDWRVRVRRTLLGDPQDTVTVRVRGGRVGTLVQETLGAPALRDGERVVLFLGADDGGRRPVLGLCQGVFRVETDVASGATSCVNSTEGLSLVDGAGNGVRADPIRLSLEDLLKRVTAGRARAETARRAAREELERRLDEWRRRALRHAELTRGKPGGSAR